MSVTWIRSILREHPVGPWWVKLSRTSSRRDNNWYVDKNRPVQIILNNCSIYKTQNNKKEGKLLISSIKGTNRSNSWILVVCINFQPFRRYQETRVIDIEIILKILIYKYPNLNKSPNKDKSPTIETQNAILEPHKNPTNPNKFLDTKASTWPAYPQTLNLNNITIRINKKQKDYQAIW